MEKSVLSRPLTALACCGTFALAGSLPAVWAAQGSGERAVKPSPKTIGYVVTDWRYGFNITPGAQECSLGVQKGEPAQARAQPGYVQVMQSYGGSYENRGPNGEMGAYNPTKVNDPLPFSELITKTSYGVNLDGTQDGRATGKTCKHEKFTSPEGEMIDNQMARVISCVHGYRIMDGAPSFGSTEVVTSAVNRRLIEISGVDDEMNDPRVEVAIYKGRDLIRRTGGGDGFIPLQSHRIDYRFPQYMSKTRGRIVNGVLITDPIPNALLPKGASTRDVGEYDLNDMTLRLKISGDKTEGLVAGYENFGLWYHQHSKNVTSGLSAFSSSSLYKAFHRYADGYPDPKTGQCTRISVTYKITGVRALIVHSQNNARLTSR